MIQVFNSSFNAQLNKINPISSIQSPMINTKTSIELLAPVKMVFHIPILHLFRLSHFLNFNHLEIFGKAYLYSDNHLPCYWYIGSILWKENAEAHPIHSGILRRVFVFRLTLQ